MGIFDIPSYSTLITEILEEIKSKIPGIATSEGSDADVLATSLAHVSNSQHIHLKYGLLYNLIPTKSSGWVLSAWMWLFGLSNGSGGYGRIVARGSTVDAGFTFVAGAGPGWVDLNGAVFTDSAGQRFQINESYTPTGAGTTSALDVISLDTGLSTNLETWRGETFTWESTPAQMEATITQTVDLDGGADYEEDAPGRARLARHLQSPSMGGNWPQWQEIAEEAVAGSIDAWVWEGAHNATDGYGTTDIACTQRGEDGSAKQIESTDALYDTINDALLLYVMYGALFRVRFLDSNEDTQDVTVKITLNSSASASQQSDWDAEDANTTISAWTPASKLLATALADITPYVTAGDRCIVYGAQAVAEKVGIADGLAADNVIQFETWFDVYDEELNPYPWPSGHSAIGDKLTSGGGLILDCVGAIREDVFRFLGPYKGSASPQTAAPIPGWEDILRLQNIQTALIVVGDAAGEAVIVDANVTTPATDITPNTGSDTDVYFLSPGEIAVFEVKP
jgi:uncharacterized phage protein gp47/JayE